MTKLLFLFVLPFHCYPFTVLIDPGHGGAFDGCASFDKKVLEKNLTLDIALRMAPLLKSHNIMVVYSRTTDRHFDKSLDKKAHFDPDTLTSQEQENYKQHLNADLAERVRTIKQKKPDIVISLHANSGGKTTHGFELFIPFEKKFPAESYMLAAHIHHALVHGTEQHWRGTLGNLNAQDRGIRQARFNILRNMPCPIVLIEMDYITHSKVENQFLQESYKQKIASVLSAGILEYYKTIAY